MADEIVSELSGLSIASQPEHPSMEEPETEELQRSDFCEESDAWESSSQESDASGSAHKQEEKIPCPCGDKAHENLEEWYENYKAWADEKELLSKDKFNEAAIEEMIRKLALQVPVINNYCPSCQRLLDEWPDIIKRVPAYDPEMPELPKYQQPHFKSMAEFEAGYLNGCHLCALFVNCTGLANLEIEFEGYHRKENRLNCLGKPTIISVLVERRSNYFKVKLEWTGFKTERWLPTNVLQCVNYDQRTLLVLEVLWIKAYKCKNNLIREKTLSILQPLGLFQDLNWPRHGLTYVQRNTRIASRLMTANFLPD